MCVLGAQLPQGEKKKKTSLRDLTRRIEISFYEEEEPQEKEGLVKGVMEEREGSTRSRKEGGW